MGELSRQKFFVQGERSRLAKLGIVELTTCLHLGLFSVHMDKTKWICGCERLAISLSCGAATNVQSMLVQRSTCQKMLTVSDFRNPT